MTLLPPAFLFQMGFCSADACKLQPGLFTAALSAHIHSNLFLDPLLQRLPVLISSLPSDGDVMSYYTLDGRNSELLSRGSEYCAQFLSFLLRFEHLYHFMVEVFGTLFWLSF